MPAYNEAAIDDIVSRIQDHAAQLGYFDRVNGHEPKNAPGSRITCAHWVDSIAPVPARSGLAATSGRLLYNVRSYQNFRSEPADAIDPAMLKATNALIGAYSGDFQLGDDEREIDLEGMYGIPLQGQAGYVDMDRVMHRVMTITLPIIINDLWEQVA